MKDRPRIFSKFCGWHLFLFAAIAQAAEQPPPIAFTKIVLTEKFHAEGAALGDLDKDGHGDAVYGPYWYAGPDFRTRHAIYQAVDFDPLKYSDNFLTFVSDVDADGWLDVIAVGFPGKEGAWFKNPGKPAEAAGNWQRHLIHPAVGNESPGFTDVTGDGRAELVFHTHTGGGLGYASPSDPSGTERWAFTSCYAGSETDKWHATTHGLGVGDVNGDGRKDLLRHDGWYEQPADRSAAWAKHAYPFGNAAQMHVTDVDGDGDNDVISSVGPHAYGLAWFEHVPKDGGIEFVRHMILPANGGQNLDGVQFSQLHSVEVADLDGDGLQDIVTGKRYWAHGPKGDQDPGGTPVLYWFRHVREPGKTGADAVRFVPHRIDDASGVGTQFALGDVNGDKRIDIVIGNKRGGFVFVQQPPKAAPAPSPAAQTAAPTAPSKPHPGVVETDPLPPAEQRTKFKLADGFRIDLVAAEPEIQKPMNLAFDARGRLWVTHSVEYPWAVPDGTTPRDGLTILEDFGPDGRARKVTRFADGLNIPIGVLPLPEGNAAIVWSIPHIWKLTDDDGDGRADRREVLYGPFGFDDTHGNQNAFRLGADGWVYANHGFRNVSEVRLRGEGPVVMKLVSGNGYRFRPDGSAIEQVAWGQVNPFGMDIDALGNRFNADCHTKPLTMLLHLGRNPSWTNRNADYDDGLGEAPQATPFVHGSTGLAAVAICDTPRMPPEQQGSVYVGNVVTNIIHRHGLEWRGSSPWAAKVETFASCTDRWFRPVDMVCGPDGCLYVADFYNCIIGHYEVDLKHPRRDRTRGRIWRISWEGAAPAAGMADLTKRSTGELLELFDDRDEVVRRLAFEQFVVRGRRDPAEAAAVASLAGGEHRRARTLRAAALLGRLEDPLVAAAGRDPSRLVRVHLVKAIDSLRDRTPVHERAVRAAIDDVDPFVRRAAAEAFVARPALDAVPSLLAAVRRADPEDKQLVHALRMAIAMPLRSATAEQLAAIAVPEADRLPLLDIVSRLPARTPALHGLAIARAVGAPRLVEESVGCLERIGGGVAATCEGDEIDGVAEFARGPCDGNVELHAAVVQAIFDGWRKAGRMPRRDGAAADLARGLVSRVAAGSDATHRSEKVLGAAVTVIDQLAVQDAFGLAVAVINDSSLPAELRRRAATAAVKLDRDRAVDVIATRLADPAEPPAAVGHFAHEIAGIDRPQVKESLAAAMATAPAATQQQLALLVLGRRDGAEMVFSLVEKGKISARLLQDPAIAGRVARLGPEVESRVRTLTAGLPPADQRIRGLIQRVNVMITGGGGTAEAGAAVFAKNCVACHKHGDKGGAVGPQLDGVAQRGPERLLEDILDPNRNVDPAFHTTVVTRTDGRVVSGLKLRDEGNDLVLADVNGREVRVPRGEIDETTVTPLSPMPANMSDQLGDQGLADLIAFLRAGRPSIPRTSRD